MKEILLPYALLCWLLFKFGVLKKTYKNYSICIGFGLVLASFLFFGSRLWAPVDFTQSAQVKAPYSVLSPTIGQQIDEIYVDHNDMVDEGELLYTLVDTGLVTQRNELLATLGKYEAVKVNIDANIVTKMIDIETIEVRLERKVAAKKHISEQEVDDVRFDYKSALSELHALKTEKNVTESEIKITLAKLDNVEFELSRMEVRAPHDGKVSVIKVSEGSRVGSLHLYDTSKKFVEFRVPDQAYDNIKSGQFSEFFVNAYPGEIFRARVHSKTTSTGESQDNLLPQERNVATFIQQGKAPVGRTVILEIDEPSGYDIPLGSTGSAWISAEKPHGILGFMDVIGGATVRLQAAKSYLGSL